MVDISNLKKVKVGDYIDVYEWLNGKRTSYHSLYIVTRLNRKRGLVYADPINSPLWKHNSSLIGLERIELVKSKVTVLE